MCTFLGLSRDLTRDDVNVEDLRNSTRTSLHLWDTDNQKEAVLFAMQSANKAGVKVALSLSDPFCVQRHKDDFLRLLKDHVDHSPTHRRLKRSPTPIAHTQRLRSSPSNADIVAITMDESAASTER